MHPLATNREQLLRLAASTLEQIESGRFAEELAKTAGLETTESVGADPDVVANALSSALDWARLEEDVMSTSGELESVTPHSADVPYIPSNQVLSLLQSAYEEHLESRATEGLEEAFDTTDPGWITVAWEKLKALLRGKRPFIRHTGAESFRYELPSNAVVVLFADWGTGEETARRVMRQIRAVNPTHAIHLGDVYYSGTPKEIEKRFLGVIDQLGPSRDDCRYFALNSNHEMYSGGYGYFDTTLPRIGQDASYFNLGNDKWQLIGLDSGYEDHGLKDPQKEWLQAQLERPGRRSILLSHHQLFSPYERRAAGRKLAEKTKDLLPNVHAWFWGHEHKCIIFGDHLGIKARCIGHGAIPSRVPYGLPGVAGVPILRVDEREAPAGGAIHGFAVLRFAGERLDVSYIDEFGTEFFAERLDVATRSMGMFMPPVHVGGGLEMPARASVADRYKRLLRRRDAGLGLESMEVEGGGEPDLSRPAIEDRVETTREALHRIVKEHLGDGSDLHEIADQIANDGRESLNALTRESPERFSVNDEFMAGLEVIVRTDGSRPSFMIRNGDVDLTTSPVGTWRRTLADSAEKLKAALACVGRIDVPGAAQGFAGTGFLIHANLIMTNRHVLQAIAHASPAGEWTFKPGVMIDFGHEFRALTSVSPRAVKRVVFSAPKVIAPPPMDHTRLDLVLIELEPAPAHAQPQNVLAVDIAPDWAVPEQIVYTVGYPGNPGLGESLSLLEQLFQSTFGCKRLAPGEIQTAQSPVHTWTLAHDASTLGGNSGSVVLVAGREGLAAGLHYGGTRADPRENWGHVIGRALGETDRTSGKTLRETLDAFGVRVVDRTSLHAAGD